MGTQVTTKEVTTRTHIPTAGSLSTKKKKEKTHDNDRVDDAVAEQAAVGGDGVETLQQQYQRFDQQQVKTVQRKDTGENISSNFRQIRRFFPSTNVLS